MWMLNLLELSVALWRNKLMETWCHRNRTVLITSRFDTGIRLTIILSERRLWICVSLCVSFLILSWGATVWSLTASVSSCGMSSQCWESYLCWLLSFIHLVMCKSSVTNLGVCFSFICCLVLETCLLSSWLNSLDIIICEWFLFLENIYAKPWLSTLDNFEPLNVDLLMYIEKPPIIF